MFEERHAEDLVSQLMAWGLLGVKGLRLSSGRGSSYMWSPGTGEDVTSVRSPEAPGLTGAEPSRVRGEVRLEKGQGPEVEVFQLNQ